MTEYVHDKIKEHMNKDKLSEEIGDRFTETVEYMYDEGMQPLNMEAHKSYKSKCYIREKLKHIKMSVTLIESLLNEDDEVNGK